MKKRIPGWFIAIVVAMILPIFSFPALIGQSAPDSEVRTLMWFYPIYLIASAVCACICYPGRREVAWIIVALMALSDAAIWYLASGYGL